MLVYAGIDEAGYGPMFGPLCIASTVFIVPDADPADGAPDLWKNLKRTVCRAHHKRRNRIAIDDSKKLKGASNGKRHPLLQLERGVLSFMTASCDRLPETDRTLFETLDARVSDADWDDRPRSIPVARSKEQLAIDVSRLSRECLSRSVQPASIRCEAIHTPRFNQEYRKTRSKAAINFAGAMRAVDQVIRMFPDEHPRIIIDRHGGRTHYLEPLQSTFPDASIRILGETETLSRYRLDIDGRLATLTFQRSAESAHLPVALASMTAKYVRELYMIRLNAFFAKHITELKPTAGYVQDGRRYLREIQPALRKLGIERQALVRTA